jgi:GNAT superfamily N-acetyltransferase/RimJ/RimL family protein N-acetyltransferase
MTAPSVCPTDRPTDIDIRVASPRDATRISALYAACYASRDDRSPTENYPFPQILLPEWVAAAIETKMVSWLLAESGDRTLGAAGLLRGLGSWQDGIAECFGLAVDPDVRLKGLGQGLLMALAELALREAKIAIGQMRTVDPVVARVVEASGFRPIGFEPFVHRMLGGVESMVTVAMLSPALLNQRSRHGGTTEAVRRLAEPILEPLGAPPLDVVVSRGTTRSDACGNLRLKELDVEVGANLTRRLLGPDPYLSGFVDLRRMDELGREHARRKQRYFAGIVGEELVGCVHTAHNRHDAHFRIESFAWEHEGAQEPMLREVVELARRESEGRPCAIVAELTATNAAQQRALESVGFAPTAYYPALVVDRGRRLDVVQYTRLLGYAVSEGTGFLDRLPWRAAEDLVRTIALGLDRVERHRAELVIGGKR